MPAMPVIISLLRGVNVGGHNMIKMDALRGLYASLGLRDAQTYVQSGNVVFRAGAQDLVRLQTKIEVAIERRFGFRPPVVLRSISDWKATMAANPFARRPGIDTRKFLVMFLGGVPSPEARKALRQLPATEDERKLIGRELFLYYPNGFGRVKLP